MKRTCQCFRGQVMVNVVYSAYYEVDLIKLGKTDYANIMEIINHMGTLLLSDVIKYIA